MASTESPAGGVRVPRDLGDPIPLDSLEEAALDVPAGARSAAGLGGAVRRLGRRPAAAVSAVVLVLTSLAIVLAGLIAPYGPLQQDLAHRLEGPSGAHLMGTDSLGRDVFSRVLFGGQLSVPAALTIVAASLIGGSIVGLVSGYLGGWVDGVLMRVTDVFFAFPVIILAMAISASLGPSLRNGIIALAVVMWPLYARVVRSVTLELRAREFVDASRVSGRSTGAILLRVILPNALPTALVVAAIDIGRAIVNLSVLSFIGLGARPPDPEWGSMVADGATVMSAWWVSAFPGLAIFVLVLAFNLVGDAIRDELDVAHARGDL